MKHRRLSGDISGRRVAAKAAGDIAISSATRRRCHRAY